MLIRFTAVLLVVLVGAIILTRPKVTTTSFVVPREFSGVICIEESPDGTPWPEPVEGEVSLRIPQTGFVHMRDKGSPLRYGTTWTARDDGGRSIAMEAVSAGLRRADDGQRRFYGGASNGRLTSFVVGTRSQLSQVYNHNLHWQPGPVTPMEFAPAKTEWPVSQPTTHKTESQPPN